MFKFGSCSQELMDTMEKSLIVNAMEKNHKFTKLAKAAEYLNTAANIFDNAGMTEEAAELTAILETLSRV